MRIKSSDSDQEKKKSNIKLLDLLVLIIILIISMVASAVVGVYYLDKEDVAYHADNISAFFSSILYQEIKYETYLNDDYPIDTLILDVPYESMQSLLNKREEAINVGVLLSGDDDLVKAEATIEDQGPYDIELRLKGDWVDHLAYSKWSYRIHVKDDQAILGMKKFSIMDPGRRNYINEWAYHKHLLYEDVLTTRYEFINVIENGKRQGIFAIEEGFNVELLESKEERQGVILTFDEDALWINRANFTEESMQMLSDARNQTLFMQTENEQAEIKVFQSNGVYNNPVLKAEADIAIELLENYFAGNLPASEVFDLDKFGKMLAITELWGANHATYWHNLRYYYNPVTSMIEPIGYDGDSSVSELSQLAVILSDQTFFKDPDIRSAYMHALQQVTQIDYLNSLHMELQSGFDQYLPVLQDEYKNENIADPWPMLEYRAEMLRNQINPPFPVLGRYSIVENEKENNLVFSVKNLMISPVSVQSFEIVIDGISTVVQANTLNFEGDLVEGKQGIEITYSTGSGKLSTPEARATYTISDGLLQQIRNAEAVTFFVNVNISGLDKVYRLELSQLNDRPGLELRPTEMFAAAEQKIDQFPFLEIVNNSTVRILSGNWQVEGDLVIPEQYEVIITPGTTLNFDDGAIFLIGNRLFAAGTESQPIVLTSSGERWAGLVVLSAGQESTVKYTAISNTTGINRNGWILTGGVTFYESPVNLSFVTFSHHQGEDALNLIHSNFHLQNVSFSSTPSDALDSDFSDGIISNGTYTDIGGDAIDVSGSLITVEDTQMKNVADKAISAGEGSAVTLSNIFIDTANIGVASKDLSSVEVDSITMNHVSYAGFAAYIKKTAYGPASINANYVHTTDVNTVALAQTGNEIVIDGQRAEEQDLDVDTLYSLGILGN